ncbi:MAG: leucine-rich repeat protein [Prevotellaceae bacterium]|jgi:hypothetical protein|nr:leucine-rich repeat protein [Prevotellaceae bacterium]
MSLITNYGSVAVVRGSKGGKPTEQPVILTFVLKSAGSIVLGCGAMGTTKNSYGVPYKWDISVDGSPLTTYEGSSSPVATVDLGTFSAGTHTVRIFKSAGAPTNWIRGLSFYAAIKLGSYLELTKVEGVFPNVPLVANCYYNMFYGCENLTSVGRDLLPATTMADSCYMNMFSKCTALVKVPELPATALATSCYESMFSECENITRVLSFVLFLPATVLANRCYYRMFYKCIGLINVPDLPATSQVTSCYTEMFSGCTSLQSIRVGATEWSITSAQNWVKDVPTGGTFTKPNRTTIPTGVSGIPSGWTVVNV